MHAKASRSGPARNSTQATATARTATLVFVFLLVPVVSAIAPRSTVGLVLALTIAMIAATPEPSRHIRSLLAPRPVLLAFLALGVYLCANAFWALDRGAAFGKVGAYAVFGLCAFVCASAIRTIAETGLTRSARTLAGGYVFGLVWVLCAVAIYDLFGQPGIRAITDAISSREVEIDWTGFFNHNVAVVTLFLFPTALALWALDIPRKKLWNVVLCALAVIAAFFSIHESSQVAIVVGLAAALLAARWPYVVRKGLLVAWVAGFVLFIPLAMLAFRAELHMAEWLGQSARARIILWNYTAEQIPKAPVLGIGIRSTRVITVRDKPHTERPEGFVYPLRAGRHSHSLFVQAWYELGLIGTLLTLLLGASLIQAIRHLPAIAQPYAMGSFAAFMGIAAFSWGIFQTWLMATYALTAILLVTAATAAKTRSEATGS